MSGIQDHVSDQPLQMIIVMKTLIDWWSHMATFHEVTQNNTGMFAKESLQQTFEILNNNLDAKLDKAYSNDDSETIKNAGQTEEWNKLQSYDGNKQ